MRLSRLILLFFATMATAVVSAQTLNDISVKMNEGGKLFNEKKYAQAIPLFKSTLDMIKKSDAEGTEAIEKQAKGLLADSYRFHAMTLAHGKKFDQAIAEFKLAIAAYDKAGNIAGKRKSEGFISSCYASMAGEKIKVKDFQGASQICMLGLEANKMDTKLMFLDANCKEQMNKDAEAIAMYQKIMDIASKTPRLKADGAKAKDMLINGQLSAASELSKKGKTQEALTKINNALKFAPKDPKAELMKIQIYSKAKDYASVIKFGPAAIAAQTIAAEKSTLYFMIGAAYVGINDNANALENYKKVTAGPNVAAAKAQITEITKSMEQPK